MKLTQFLCPTCTHVVSHVALGAPLLKKRLCVDCADAYFRRLRDDLRDILQPFGGLWYPAPNLRARLKVIYGREPNPRDLAAAIHPVRPVVRRMGGKIVRAYSTHELRGSLYGGGGKHPHPETQGDLHETLDTRGDNNDLPREEPDQGAGGGG